MDEPLMKTRQRCVGHWTPTLRDWLEARRQRRAFDAAAVLQAKVRAIADLSRTQNLTAAVVGVSGGIDSAVVLALLARAAQSRGSRWRLTIPLLLPCSGEDSGATGQAAATARGREICEALGLAPATIDIRPMTVALEARLSEALPQFAMSRWARGQLVATMRTPALYAVTSLLFAAGERAVVVGTTNRDEGAYLGFFGKASDAMVDIQPISDLHKSEVRALARLLGIPPSIMEARPSGDLFDGAHDEDLFGAPYDFVEGYLLDKAERTPAARASGMAAWDPASRQQFAAWASNLENLHEQNAHKYRVGSPAIHLDVLDRGVPGGWTCCPDPRGDDSSSRASEDMAAPMTLPACEFARWITPAVQWRRCPIEQSPADEGAPAHVHVFAGVLTEEGTHALGEALTGAMALSAGPTGRWRDYRSGAPVHSFRTTVVCTDLAAALWAQLRPHLPPFRSVPDDGHGELDAPPGSVWRPIGVNRAFRVIRYADGGRLVPHYDTPYIAAPGRRSLMSVVVYLSASGEGGALRFLRDAQRRLPFAARDLSDGIESDEPEDAWLSLKTGAGDLVVFDHCLRHESTRLMPGQVKVLMRTDVMFQRVGPAVDD